MKDGGENETKLIFKELENAFKIVCDGDKRWEELLKTTEKAAKSHNYLLDQLKNAKRFQGDSEVEKQFPKLKDLLTFKISEKISEEIELLESTRKECKKILDSVFSKQHKIISMLTKQETVCTEARKGLENLEECTNCFSFSYLKMSCAVIEAEALEQEIPLASFAYPPSQRQTIDRALMKWKFYYPL